MYKFSKNSLKNIKTVHVLLQELAIRSIELSSVDMIVLNTGGLRTAEMQNEIYKEGNSKADGYEKKSYHQSGMAIDLVPYINGPTWSNPQAFIEIKKAVDTAWKNMLHGNYFLHWGGYWGAVDLDGDGILEIEDKLGWDCAHYELRTYPQVKGVHPVG